MSQISGENFSEDAREFEGKKYALVVGINQSTNMPKFLPPLRYAESDAAGISYLLGREACNFAFPSGYLIGTAASTQNVRKAISYLIDGKSENDLLLFYFVGYGYPVEIGEGKFEVFLATADFDPHGARLDPDIYLSLSWIREMLYERQKTASVISILDCYDASSTLEPSPPQELLTQSLNAFAEDIMKAELLPTPSHRTWAVLASSSDGANAYGHSEDHALMTGLIVDALSGDARDALDMNGDLTLQTLHAYLQTQMTKPSITRLEWSHNKPFILAHHPSKNPILRSPDNYPLSSSKQSFDMDISPATFADLDLEHIQMFLKKERIQVQQDYRADSSAQAQMQALGLLRGEHPSYGTLLCFGRDPSHQIVGAYTRCIYWNDTERLSGWENEREYQGSLLQQFTQARDFLRNHLRFSRVIERGGSRERPEIPFRVLEDALANALIHREYVTEPDHTVRTEGVLVEIFSDRVEIMSPGGPPVPLDGKSHPRNPQIMRIFYLAGYVEKPGTGIERMNYLMQDADLPQPDIRPSRQTFTVILFRPMYTPALTVQAEADTQISQTQVPSPTGRQKVHDDASTPDQSNPEKSNKRLTRPVPITSPTFHRPLLAGLSVSLIVVVILALVAHYLVSKESYLLSPTPPLEPASTTIEIASEFPTSGLDTTSGLPLQNGVQMAITEANNKHLLPGYTLKLVPYDDVGTDNRHDPEKGANNLKEAIADNLVTGVIGPYNSSVAFKELPLANQAPLALLSPAATFSCLTKSATDDPNCTDINDIATHMRPTRQLTFFRLAATTDRQGKAAADYFLQTKHYSKVLLLKDESDVYSFGLAQAFQTEWQRRGGLVISVDLPQNVSSVQDYQNTLQAVASSQPHLIYFAGNEPNDSYVLQALSAIAMLKTVPFVGGGGIMERSLLQTATSLHRDAPVYASQPLQDPDHSGTATGINFMTNYMKNGYQDYRPHAALAYDCTIMLIQAIKTALQNKSVSTPHGTQDHTRAVQFRQAVLQALRPLSYTGVTGMHSFDANGDTTNHTISFYQVDLSTPQPSWMWLQQVNA